MATTPTEGIDSHQIKTGAVQRQNLNVNLSGLAVITKLIAGTGVTLSSTGADAGTGDVVVSVAAGTAVTSLNTRTGAVTLTGADVPPFGASGSGHAPGSVPDPGGAAGSTRFLREDGTWSAPPAANGSGGTSSGVTSVAAADTTLNLSGTTSAPALALNLANVNVWTGAQTFPILGVLQPGSNGYQFTPGQYPSLALTNSAGGTTNQIIFNPGEGSTYFDCPGYFYLRGALNGNVRFALAGATGQAYFGNSTGGGYAPSGGGQLNVQVQNAGIPGLVIQAASGQAAPYIEGLSSTSAQVWAVDQNGAATFAGVKISGLAAVGVVRTNASGAFSTAALTAADLPVLAPANLPPVGTAGTYGDAAHYPVMTVDSFGRVTAVSTQASAPGSADPPGFQIYIPGPLAAGPDTLEVLIPSFYDARPLTKLSALLGTAGTTATTFTAQLDTAAGAFAAAETSDTFTIPANINQPAPATAFTVALTASGENRMRVDILQAGTGAKDLTVKFEF